MCNMLLQLEQADSHQHFRLWNIVVKHSLKYFGKFLSMMHNDLRMHFFKNEIIL